MVAEQRLFTCPECGAEHLPIEFEGLEPPQSLLEDFERAEPNSAECSDLARALAHYKPGAIQLAPKLAPCSACEGGEEQREKQRVDAELVRAGFHEEQIGWQFENAERAVLGETDAELQTRVLTLGPRVFGITHSTASSVDALGRWDPRKSGVPRMLVLYGSTGVGKSTLMSMVARRFLEPDRWERVPMAAGDAGGERQLEQYRRTGRAFRLRVRRSVPVRYVHMRDLLDHQRQRSWKALPDVMKRLGKWRGILFLDEFALSDDPDKVELQAVEDMVDVRSIKRLPLVVATNRAKGELTGEGSIYGDRVADRMRPTKNGRGRCVYLQFQGQSWR